MGDCRTNQTSSSWVNHNHKSQTKWVNLNRIRTSYLVSTRCNHSNHHPVLDQPILLWTQISWTMWTLEMPSTGTTSPTMTTLIYKAMIPILVYIIHSLCDQIRVMEISSNRTVMVLEVWKWCSNSSNRWSCRTWCQVEWTHWSQCKTSRQSARQQAPRICCYQVWVWLVTTPERLIAPVWLHSWSQPCRHKTTVVSSIQLETSTSSLIHP